MSYAVSIKIIETDKCPLYKTGDKFKLSGRIFSLPPHKPACITLLDDIKQVRELCRSLEKDNDCTEEDTEQWFKCSGPADQCEGIISAAYKRIVATEPEHKTHDNELVAIAKLLSKFSIFQTLDESNIQELISFLKLKLKKFPPKKVIIKKGDPGINLFIILSGKIEVLGDNDISIAYLGKGEVFGEMSLLSGEAIGATIRVVEPVWLLIINGKDFRRVLNKFPSLQMYFARLLAKRLTQTNVARSQDFASAMTGKLSEIPPTELLQTLNQNQKTGVLSLDLPKGPAKVCFREGGLILVEYNEKQDQEALFSVLKAKEGRFKFVPELPSEHEELSEIGDFMWLLMEGLNRIDEGR